MTTAVPMVSAPTARGVIRWVCTKNPFYVISAGLFLAGLNISFGDPRSAEDTWGMMTGLAGYTLLLASAALLLVRYVSVWNDVRTVLLLIVLMFLATSVTFDEVLALERARGFICYLSGLFFAMGVSETLLHGMRLRLPVLYRVPYYLILALFFLYPLALSPILAAPRSEPLLWGLFAFSSCAGLVFLTLLPAIRRGAEYVRDNGSPWPWPLYPWSLFAFLALAVLGRAFLLCWSLHLLDGPDLNRFMFAPYFLVPFGFALAVLLLEGGIVSRRHGILALALFLPPALVVVALAGQRSDPVYQHFLEIFTSRLGGDPPYLTLLAAAGFYGYAAVRGVRFATEALTATLASLAFVAPETFTAGLFTEIQAWPILMATLLQLGLGLWQRDPWRCLWAAFGASAVVGVLLSEDTPRGAIAFHLALLAALVVGALLTDWRGRFLRFVAALMVLLASTAVLLDAYEPPATVPAWIFTAYPLLTAVLLALYGRFFRQRSVQAVGGVIASAWLLRSGWTGYRLLRYIVVGLDYLALGLVVFALAVLVSLGKAGALPHWLMPRKRTQE